jgi:DNA-binding IclR family transcriptional regulator
MRGGRFCREGGDSRMADAESYAEAAQIRAVLRAVRVLKALARHPRGVTITELARELHMPKSSVYRLLATLRQADWVTQMSRSERYGLGLGLLEMTADALEAVSLRELAREHLEELWETTGESVHLGVLHDDHVVYVMKYESRHSIRMYSQVGKRAPLYCTALGKAILAWLPEEEREALLARVQRVRYTANTLVDERALSEALAETRRRGYAVDDAEHEDFVRCVAAPILGPRDTPVGAVSISAPIFRMPDERVHEWGILVREHSRRITQRARTSLAGALD